MSKKVLAILGALTLALIGSVYFLTIDEREVSNHTFMWSAVAAALGLFYVALLFIYSCEKRVRSRIKLLRKDQSLVENRVEALHKKTDTLGDYAGSILRLARSIEETVEEPDKQTTQTFQSYAGSTHRGLIDSDENAESSYFSPLYLPATPIESKPSAHLPGRFAAQQLVGEPTDWKFEALLSTPESASSDFNVPHVAFIGKEDLCQDLERVGKVRQLIPHFSLEQLDASISYLIIDELNIDETPWAGVSSAQSTLLLRKLLELLVEAKARHVLVVLLASEVVDHNSFLLHGYADVIVDSAGNFDVLPWGEDLTLPLLDVCAEHRRK